MRKRIMASIASGFFITAALASPAAAGWDHHETGDPDDCPHDAVCFWKGDGFDGPMSVRTNPGPNCDVAPDWRIGSVVNNLDEKVYLYKDDDCDHLTEVVHAGEWEEDTHAHSWL